MTIPNYWLRAREAWLREQGRWDEYVRMWGAMTGDGVPFAEKHEQIDAHFGLTYELLRPWIDRVNAEQAAKRASRRSKASDSGGEAPPAPPPDAAAGAAAEPPAEQPVGGDIADVRWALANLSLHGVGPKDAPSPIAWSLLVIGRSGTQGQLKLLDVYRATIIQPAAKAAEEVAPSGEQDDRLDELLARLARGIDAPG